MGASPSSVVDLAPCARARPKGIEPEELKAPLEEGPGAILLVDVRQPDEHAYCRIPGSWLIRWPELPWRASELDPRADLYCYRGIILRGGIRAWAARVGLPLPLYGVRGAGS